MKKKRKIILLIISAVLLVCAAYAVAIAAMLHLEADYDDPESLFNVAEKAEYYLVLTHPDKDSPELQAALKELNDIAFLDASDEKKIKLIRARFPEESFWPDELKALLRSAESGDRDAQYRLGCLYSDNGPLRASAGRELMRHVINSQILAGKWFRKAALQGHADAQYRLAECYENWHPVIKGKARWSLRTKERTTAETDQWMNAAAENGNMYAARSRHDADTSSDSWKQAGCRIREAAEQGDAVALESDLVSHTPECLLKNAENGSVFAMCNYAKLCERGIEDWVENEATSEFEKVVTREPDGDEAMLWKRKAFDAAMEQLENNGDPQDLYTFVHAFTRFRSSTDFIEGIISEEELPAFANHVMDALWKADQHNILTFSLLNTLHLTFQKKGLETEDDAVFYRKLMKHCGLLSLQLKLAEILLDASRTEAEKTEAVGLLRKLAVLGNDRARQMLGQCYLDGTGVPQDKAEAVKWLRLAAKQRNTDAMRSLADCLKAPGDPHDEKEAADWKWKIDGRGLFDSRMEYCYLYGRDWIRMKWEDFKNFLTRTISSGGA